MDMTRIIIKKTSKTGQDLKIFRAYFPSSRLGQRDEPLGVSASTTGNSEWGIIRCAAKAFKKFSTPEVANEVNEMETRVMLRSISEVLGVWEATLQ